MISALVINVKSAEERRKFQEDQLADFGIPFEILDATRLTVDEADAYSEGMKMWERPIRHTEVAAMDSHKRAWQCVVDLQKPLLILEDDAILSPQTAIALRTLEPILTMQNIECLTLETRSRRKWLGLKPWVSLPLNSQETVDLYPLVQDRSGLAAYILTPEGAEKLIRYNENRLGLADALVWGTYSLRTAQSVPALATQADRMEFYGRQSPINASSFIAAGEEYDKSSILFRLRRFVGHVKLAARVLQFSFRTKRKFVPLIDF